MAYVRNGEEHIVKAAKEVILSGGTINSPQILMLSGIGPRQQLEALDIDVIHDLPGIGRNLQDHMTSPVAFTTDHEISLASAASEIEGAKFQSEQMGMRTSNIAEAGGFATLFDGSPAPELQFHFIPGLARNEGKENSGGHGFTLLPTLVGTRSVGRMWLRSSNPLDKPALDPAYLEDERDMEILVRGTRIARDILSSGAFDVYRRDEHLPGKEAQSDEDLKEHIRNCGSSIYHPVGTCKMGTDDMAVVDDRLRVRGIERLRVADASIMPHITNANTNAPSIMIGEQCSDFVLEDS